MELEAECLCRAPHYCSTGWSLYDKLAETFMNFETGEQYSAGKFAEEEHAACLARLDEHFKTCVQCSIEESRFEKKRATPVR